MPAVEERLAYLEGQVSEYAHAFVDIRESIRQLERRMDMKFEGVEKRFESIDRRFQSVDQKFDALDQKMSRQFVWLVGMQVTTLIAVVSALVARA